jgi:hypothetical protein
MAYANSYANTRRTDANCAELLRTRLRAKAGETYVAALARTVCRVLGVKGSQVQILSARPITTRVPWGQASSRTPMRTPIPNCLNCGGVFLGNRQVAGFMCRGVTPVKFRRCSSPVGYGRTLS